MVQTKDVTHLVQRAQKHSSIFRNKLLPITLIAWPIALVLLLVVLASSINFAFSAFPQSGIGEFVRISLNIVFFIVGAICFVLGPISILAGIILLTIKRRLRQ